MEEALYDTLAPVLAIPRLPAALSALVSRPPAGSREVEYQQRERLSSHADEFRNTLGRGRPRYEDEEEREKLGGLRQCTWSRLDNLDGAAEDDQRSELRARRKRKRKIGDDDEDGGHSQLRGLAVSLVYEKETFHFVIYTSSSRSDLPQKRNRTAATTYQRTTESREESAILLSKSSSAALKSFTNYLRDTFAVTAIYPFDPSSSLLQSTIEKYLDTIRTSLSDSGDTSSAAVQQNFSSIIGKIELTVSFSHSVAKGLRSIHVAIPATSFLTWCKPLEALRGQNRGCQKTFLGSLAGWIRAKSGLGLPIFCEKDGLITQQHDQMEGDNNNQSDNHDDDSNIAGTPSGKDALALTTMKISKISTEAYTISATSGLKFKSRAVHIAADMTSVDTGADEQERDNCVRRANSELLLAIIDHVRREANSSDTASTT